MAQTYQFDNVSGNNTAANVSALGAQILFADQILVTTDTNETGVTTHRLQSTSRFALGDGASLTGGILLADDSAVETQFEQSVGKFVDGNLIFGYAPLTEVKSDVRNYIFYPVTGDATTGFFTGVCNTTQSQDYTPALVSNSRNLLMISADQARSLASNIG